MKIKIKINLLVLALIVSASFAQVLNRGAYSSNSIPLITGDDYVTGEDGTPRITLNVWGHVKYPGAYLMYDGIDLLTALAIAGGPLKGANTKKIKVISRDGSVQLIDIEKMVDSNKILSTKLKPHDTIHVDETFGSYILSRGNVINVLIQVTNLVLIATNNKN